MYIYDIEILFIDFVEMKFLLIIQLVYFYGFERKGVLVILVENEKFVKDVDVYVIVLVEYNYNVFLVLINFLDVFFCSVYFYKFSGFVCYFMGQYVIIFVLKFLNNFCIQIFGVIYFF